ncbi:hypothetical protein FNV43_RR04534 [Rhamnella rubrinervis]|uniref:Uncharacterized protein n=1 Tax=Rhamnella rubrinervis TaxID=2594499 RepID=A0A8K0MPV5_9ROSA|nr:hypothetical protein FNV43_RR04534 [Rhamnella rubrinervis]
MGARKFGTPKQDFNKIRDHFYSHKQAEPHRILEEVQTTHFGSTFESTNDNNYNTFDMNKILVDKEDDEEPVPNKEMARFSANLSLIRKLLLSYPEVEFLWWMDSDAKMGVWIVKVEEENERGRMGTRVAKKEKEKKMKKMEEGAKFGENTIKSLMSFF